MIFANTAGGSACDWEPFAKGLVADGHQVLLYDYASPDGPIAERTGELRTVVKAAKTSGADRIVVVGGSRGGCLALVEAAANQDIDAVAVLSCAKVWNQDDPTPLKPYLPKVSQPVLSVVAKEDPDVSVKDVRSDRRAIGPDADVQVVPGSSHGDGLLDTSAVTTRLTSFIKKS